MQGLSRTRESKTYSYKCQMEEPRASNALSATDDGAIARKVHWKIFPLGRKFRWQQRVQELLVIRVGWLAGNTTPRWVAE